MADKVRLRYNIERPGAAWRVRRGQQVVWESEDPRGVCEALEGDLNIYVAEHSPRHIFVHAGVVAWKGRAIVLPGRSFSGKSTLVDALVRAGAAYLSDEFAPIDAQGRVHSFPRPLKLRQAVGWPLRISPHRLGAPVDEPLPIGAVIVTRFEPGAAWEATPITWGEAMLSMLDNTVPARSRPRTALSVLGNALAGVGMVKGIRGEAAEAAHRILLESTDYYAE